MRAKYKSVSGGYKDIPAKVKERECRGWRIKAPKNPNPARYYKVRGYKVDGALRLRRRWKRKKNQLKGGASKVQPDG